MNRTNHKMDLPPPAENFHSEPDSTRLEPSCCTSRPANRAWVAPSALGLSHDWRPSSDVLCCMPSSCRRNPGNVEVVSGDLR